MGNPVWQLETKKIPTKDPRTRSQLYDAQYPSRLPRSRFLYSRLGDTEAPPEQHVDSNAATDLQIIEHPIRRYLNHAFPTIPQQPQAPPLIGDTEPYSTRDLENIIMRQLGRPRRLTMAIGAESAEIAQTITMETAMERLRRHLLGGTSLLNEGMNEVSLEPRDRLEASRTTRRVRAARVPTSNANINRLQHSSSLIAESFQRWTLNRRQAYQQNDRVDPVRTQSIRQDTTPAQSSQAHVTQPRSEEATNFTSARSIYQQTAMRIQRTRQLLSNREQQHSILSERLQQSTRAIGQHIETLREAMSDARNSMQERYEDARHSIQDTFEDADYDDP